MFQDVIGVIHQIDIGPQIRLGDEADKLSSLWTFALTISLALMMAIRTFILNPIECRISPRLVIHKSDNFPAFVNSYCLIKGTTYMKDFSSKTNDGDGKIVEYLPWIPLYLGIMALLPFGVCLLWKVVWSRQTGGELRNLINISYKAQLEDGTEKRKSVERISTCIADILWFRRQYDDDSLVNFKLCIGSFLNSSYILIKVFYLLSHALCVFAMHSFLGIGNSQHFFGFQFFSRIIRGNFTEATRIFPRITLCRLPSTDTNPTSYHNIQCVVPGNLFSETTFAILWTWHTLMFFVMFFSLISCLYRLIRKNSVNSFLRRGIILAGVADTNNEDINDKIDVFSRNFLHQDGIFILRMIDKVVGPLITNDIIAGLWRRYDKIHDCVTLSRSSKREDKYSPVRKDSEEKKLHIEEDDTLQVV